MGFSTVLCMVHWLDIGLTESYIDSEVLQRAAAPLPVRMSTMVEKDDLPEF
jgi:hypothetical protein